MNRFLSLCALLIAELHAASGQSGLDPSRVGVLTVNEIDFWVEQTGVLAHRPGGAWGLAYPRNEAGLVEFDNMLWVGKVNDGHLPEIRGGGGLWGSPIGERGPISVDKQPMPELGRVYRFRRIKTDLALRHEAALLKGVDDDEATSADIDSLRERYAADEAAWPVHLGAPFEDLNNSGSYDAGDRPGLFGADQIFWVVYNDIEYLCSGYYPTGLEIQITVWAHGGIEDLSRIIFKRVRFIYKGLPDTPANATIDSMYVGNFVETQVGSYADDLAGTDTTLGLAYSYNGPEPDTTFLRYSRLSHGIGYRIMAGPRVAATSAEQALFDAKWSRGWRNLEASGVLMKPTPSGIAEPGICDPGFYFWNGLRGRIPFRTNPEGPPWSDPWGKTTSFPLWGDPVAKTGWYDAHPAETSASFDSPGGRRFTLSTGPFTMALADTQEVYYACIAATSSSAVGTVPGIKYYAQRLNGLFPYDDARTDEQRTPNFDDRTLAFDDYSVSQAFPNPFNPLTSIEFTLPIDGYLTVTVNDILGREVRTLENGFQSAGRWLVNWDGRGPEGALLPSGVYFVRFEIRGFVLTRRVVLVR